MSDKLAMNQNLEQKLSKPVGPHFDTATDSQFIFLERIWSKKAEKLHFWKIQDPRGGSSVEIRYPRKTQIWEKWNKYVVEKKNGIACFSFLRHLFDIQEFTKAHNGR